ncbi:hypothetical protein [Clostridioides sp. ES-S-0049-02]|uniref:hypothetical protein n=1 Tax=Clostridioides sp. ES-S-0049-02 TaxID=2770778 RepID=UPI001D11214B
MEKYATMIKENLNAGKVLCGIAVSLSDSAVSELVGLSGYDFVWIEGEHGALDRKDIQQHMIAALLVVLLLWLNWEIVTLLLLEL